MALTKIDIVQNISDRLGTSKRDSTRIVESVFEIIKEQLSEGNKVKKVEDLPTVGADRQVLKVVIVHFCATLRPFRRVDTLLPELMRDPEQVSSSGPGCKRPS